MNMESTVIILIYVAVVLSFVGSIVWIYRDARARGRPGTLIAFLAAVLVWPMSLLVWIALRPPIQPGNGRNGAGALLIFKISASNEENAEPIPAGKPARGWLT